MGGRGSSSGISDKGKKYGTEYQTVAQFGGIKVIRTPDGQARSPQETMANGRVYAVLDKFNDIKYIVFYDNEKERVKQIDIKGKMHEDKIPHTHYGYEHDEYGTYPGVTDRDKKIVDKVLQSWDHRRKKLNL